MNKNFLILVMLVVIVGVGVLILKPLRSTNKTFQDNFSLQISPYTDNNSGFEINLPIGWTTKNIATSTNFSNTWFHNISKEETSGSITLVIGRFERTADMNRSIKELSNIGFIEEIAKQMRAEINQYSIISTSTVKINGISYYQNIGSYVGSKSNKKAVQYIYLTITDSAYYLIGIDSYDEIWEKNKKTIMESINTLKLL